MTVELPRLRWEVPDWHQTGACQLFPELDWIEAKPKTAEALACKTICGACPVRFVCALGALERGEKNGIWGGLSDRERKKIAISFGFPIPGDPPAHGTNSRRVKWGCDCRPCKDAHALYESMRRAKSRARRVWSGPLLVLTVPVRTGGRVARPGQLVLPLAVPAPKGAVRETPDEAALPAAA